MVGMAHLVRLAGVVTVMSIRPALAPNFEALQVWGAWSEVRVSVCMLTLALVARPSRSGLLVSSPTATGSVAACTLSTGHCHGHRLFHIVRWDFLTGVFMVVEVAATVDDIKQVARLMVALPLPPIAPVVVAFA